MIQSHQDFGYSHLDILSIKILGDSEYYAPFILVAAEVWWALWSLLRPLAPVGGPLKNLMKILEDQRYIFKL